MTASIESVLPQQPSIQRQVVRPFYRVTTLCSSSRSKRDQASQRLEPLRLELALGSTFHHYLSQLSDALWQWAVTDGRMLTSENLASPQSAPEQGVDAYHASPLLLSRKAWLSLWQASKPPILSLPWPGFTLKDHLMAVRYLSETSEVVFHITVNWKATEVDGIDQQYREVLDKTLRWFQSYSGVNIALEYVMALESDQNSMTLHTQNTLPQNQPTPQEKTLSVKDVDNKTRIDSVSPKPNRLQTAQQLREFFERQREKHQKPLEKSPSGDSNSSFVGAPHPNSLAEKHLAHALQRDQELAAFFQFNQTLSTVLGNTFIVDLLSTRYRIVIEIDGYQWHGDKTSFRKDRQRDYELLISDYTVLRLTAEEVLEERLDESLSSTKTQNDVMTILKNSAVLTKIKAVIRYAKNQRTPQNKHDKP